MAAVKASYFTVPKSGSHIITCPLLVVMIEVPRYDAARTVIASLHDVYSGTEVSSGAKSGVTALQKDVPCGEHH